MTRFTCVGCGLDCLGPPDHPVATKACNCPTRVVKNQDTGKNEWCDDGQPNWKERALSAEARANTAETALSDVRAALEDAYRLFNQIALKRAKIGPLATQAQQMAHRLASLNQPSNQPGDGA